MERRMASNTIHFKNPHTGENRKAPVGYSWTVFFFWFITPLFRSDWKGAGLLSLLGFVGSWILHELGAPPPAAFWIVVIFAAFYNKFYIKQLVQKGYQAYGIELGVLAEELSVHKLDGLVPVLKEPQTNQKSQEPEPKNEGSVEDRLRNLQELKENNLINDEEYNKKKEKLLEEL
jgi:hypothetical protein